MSSTRCHTFTGSFDPMNPRAADVVLEDIAHHLAMTCRFGGAVPVFYSVAQHAAIGARYVLEITGNPLWALHFNHHDSAEAYVHDIRRPIKSALQVRTFRESAVPFAMVESWTMSAIREGLELPAIDLGDVEKVSQLIRDVDNAMLRAEMRGLLHDEPGRGCWSPYKIPDVVPEMCLDWRAAESLFLGVHHDLMQQMEAAKC
jgi:hypothetical protein